MALISRLSWALFFRHGVLIIAIVNLQQGLTRGHPLPRFHQAPLHPSRHLKTQFRRARGLQFAGDPDDAPDIPLFDGHRRHDLGGRFAQNPLGAQGGSGRSARR